MDTGENSSSKKDEPADFDTAINATGFGLFNFILLLVAVPSCIGPVLETSTMSYILPSAECDLKLDLMNKGVLNGITYAGMISSAIPWGFVADTKGRRKILIFGFLGDAIATLGGALSQNLISLMVFKFLGGFMICGPFAVLMSYMTEFHGAKYRARMMMVIGMLFCTATALLPGLAWLILPNAWNFYFFDNTFAIHSWQIFLAICALPSLTASLVYIFLPESPKFLMTRGRNEEALEILRTVYSLNHRKPKETYPFTKLFEEAPQKVVTDTPNKKGTMLHFLHKGLIQLKPMFFKPYLGYSFITYILQFCILLGLNTIRLWLPQLFTSLDEFANIQSTNNLEQGGNLCAMIEYSVNKSETTISKSFESCEVVISSATYINTIIVGVAGMIGYSVAGTLINALGNKCILIVVIRNDKYLWSLVLGLSISSCCGIGMYWATNSVTVLVLSSIYVTVGSIGSTSLLGIIVNLFPTSLRTMILSISMMFGRFGALIGNILFPYFLSLGCLPPFFMNAFIMFTAAALGCTLPKLKAVLK